MRLLFNTAILMLMLVAPPVEAAESKTYECDAAKERAKVAVYLRNEVSITADRDLKECRFSVNGATVGSPPSDLIYAGLRLIARQQMSGAVERGEIAPLAYALLAAAPVVEIPDKLWEMLNESKYELAKCFGEYEAGSHEFVTAMDDIVCRIVPRTESSRVLEGGLVRVTTSGPELQLAVRVGGFEHYIFVPLSLSKDWFD